MPLVGAVANNNGNHNNGDGNDNHNRQRPRYGSFVVENSVEGVLVGGLGPKVV